MAWAAHRWGPLADAIGLMTGALSGQVANALHQVLEAAKDLISTAQAAELLGYSRPYVVMLIDQNKLKGATVSAGDHRRVSRAVVMEWHDRTSGVGGCVFSCRG